MTTTHGAERVVGPTLAQVVVVAQEVWATIIGGELLRLAVPDTCGDAASPPGTPGPEADGAWVRATMQVRGAWNGVLVLDLGEAAAVRVTRSMLGQDAGTHEDVVDAVGELVNIIGGNVKGLLPGPSTLDLPGVSHDSPSAPVLADGIEVVRADLCWGSEPLRVSVHVACRP